jgi:hypothetical protein
MPAPASLPPEVEVAIVGSGFSGLVHRHPVQAGRHRLVRHPREGRPRRRHLAREHLPRRRLRRPLAPLLLLLRAEPDLDALLLPAAGDPRLPRALRRQVRRPPAHPLPRRGHRGPLDDTPRLDLTLPRRPDRARPRLVLGNGALHVPAYPDIPGLADFRGPCFHSARWDHTVDLRGKRVAVIGTGASADPVRPAIAPIVDSSTCSSAHPPGSCRSPTTRSAPPPRPLRPPPRPPAAHPRRPSTGSSSSASSAFNNPRLMALPSRSRRHIHRSVQRPRPARRPDPALPHGLQAHPPVQRLLPRPHPRQRRARHRPIDRVEPTGVRTRDGQSCARSTSSSSAPASASTSTSPPSRSSASPAASSTPPGSGPPAPTSASPSPASPTCSC